MFPTSSEILLIEDSISVAHGIMEMLANLKLNKVTHVTSVESALQIIKEKLSKESVFDLIIADHYLPNKTGFELLLDLKINPQYEHVPYLTITSDSRKANVLPYIALGASNFIVKPINASLLKEKLNSIWMAKQKN